MNKAITACASLRVVALNSIFQFFLNNNYGLRAIKIQRLCCYRYLYYPRVSQPQNSHYQLCMPFEYYSRPSPATKSPTYERIAMTKRVCACLEYSNGRFNQCQNRETIGEHTERSIINAQWFNVRISRAQQSKPKINQLPALALKTSLFLAMNFYGISSYCLMRRCSARCNRQS